ncbi:uncharacterized protein LOC124437452 isoform X2 [Xenia sp. Carnegie-2017]|uniref:uncharacterized protein LOC124437452 isoform X2 n=1 Tax=Xenia sp. Carnegie-2017 TaxID=2897299 RepID=UPI001F03A98A|nr:uncharacterized protein LOC124437452 isoform X2 [Xenia sp. Carnegie-2017]
MIENQQKCNYFQAISITVQVGVAFIIHFTETSKFKEVFALQKITHTQKFSFCQKMDGVSYWRFLMFFCVLSAKVEGLNTKDSRFVKFISTPDKVTNVLDGRNAKLEWVFQLTSNNSIKIMLFTYDRPEATKKWIARKTFPQRGTITHREEFSSYKSTISIDQNGNGHASILVPEVKSPLLYDSYGLKFESSVIETAVEDSVGIRIVDMVAGRDSKQPQIITRWYGQQVNLKCDVHHDKKVVPTFQWYKRLPRTHEKEKYLGETVWNTLTLIIVNDTCFGAYFCKAISNMREVVELKFQIHKLGYPGSPSKVIFKRYSDKGKHVLHWEKPLNSNKNWVKEYAVEKLDGKKGIWIEKHRTKRFLVTVNDVQAGKYRVCSVNEAGYNCSTPVSLPNTRKTHFRFDAVLESRPQKTPNKS